MGWFPSLICKNYNLKDFVKTAEALKFCMIVKIVTLRLEKTTAPVKCVNFSNAKFANLCSVNWRNGNSFYFGPSST